MPSKSVAATIAARSRAYFWNSCLTISSWSCCDCNFSSTVRSCTRSSSSSSICCRLITSNLNSRLLCSNSAARSIVCCCNCSSMYSISNGSSNCSRLDWVRIPANSPRSLVITNRRICLDSIICWADDNESNGCKQNTGLLITAPTNNCSRLSSSVWNWTISCSVIIPTGCNGCWLSTMTTELTFCSVIIWAICKIVTVGVV